MTERLTYTVEEASRLCGVSRGVGYEAARRGELPTIRLGRRLLVPKVALDRMLGLENDERPNVTPAVRETSTIAPAGDRVPAAR
jgi:excisionase family DNA binding protein